MDIATIHNTNRGYQRGGFDPTDKPYYYRGTALDWNRFKGVNLTKETPKFYQYDQGNTNSCVANATACAVKYLADKDNQGSEGLQLDPSRLFIYYNARAIEIMKEQSQLHPGKPREWPLSLTDSGTTVREALQSLSYFGIASEETWPWKIGKDRKHANCVREINDRPPQAAYENAAKTHTLEFCRLDPDHTDEVEAILEAHEKEAIGIVTLARVKQCLVEGLPVVFGFRYLWDASQRALTKPASKPEDEGFPILDDIPVNMRHKVPAQGIDWGAHAVLAVGFNSSTQRVLIHNSWGSGADFLPYFWMPYEWITDFGATDDFWMVRRLDREPVPKQDRWNVPEPPNMTFRASSASEGLWGLTQQQAMANDIPLGARGPIAGVSRKSSMAEFFYVAEDGSVVRDVWREGKISKEGKIWTSQTIYKAPGHHGIASPSITAVSRDEDHVELWWITKDGAVKGAHNYTSSAGENFTVYQLSPPGTAQPGAGITALSRHKDTLELWWVGPEGQIEGRFWYRSTGEAWGVYCHAGKGSAAKYSALTSHSLSPDRLNLFWVRPDGGIGGMWWQEQSGWQHLSLPSTALYASIDSPLTCAAPWKDKIMVFFMGDRGEIGVLQWHTNGVCTMDESMEVTYGRLDSGMQAVSIKEGRVDLFWVAGNNALMFARKHDAVPNTAWAIAEAAAPGAVMAGSPLGRYSRLPNTFSVMFKSYKNETVIIDWRP